MGVWCVGVRQRRRVLVVRGLCATHGLICARIGCIGQAASLEELAVQDRLHAFGAVGGHHIHVLRHRLVHVGAVGRRWPGKRLLLLLLLLLSLLAIAVAAIEGARRIT